VTVIDGATDSVLVTVASGRNPGALCCDSTYNKVYCANQGYGNWLDSTVTVIDCVTDSVIATIGVGVRPMDLAWNPVQNRVYVANYNSSSISVLADTGGFVGMEESFRPRASSRKPLPTIVRGILFLPRDMTETAVVSDRVPRPLLLDVTGRKVLHLLPGANDVRALAPGVYFVREEPQASSPKPQAVRKVVVTR
jgi:YVTN family beta-propeller protein